MKSLDEMHGRDIVKVLIKETMTTKDLQIGIELKGSEIETMLALVLLRDTLNDILATDEGRQMAEAIKETESWVGGKYVH